MHAKYVSTSTATIAQIIADIAALIVGSTVASLSASCDKANTTLISTVAPGWTVFDAAAPATGQVITAPDADGLTTKFVRIFAGNALSIDMQLYDSWNAVTHAGVNPSNSFGATSGPAFTAGAVNTYWIFATPRMLYITDAGQLSRGAWEYSREIQYLKGTTYPCQMCVAASALNVNVPADLFVPRVKALSAAGDLTAASSTLRMGSIACKSVNAAIGVGSPASTARDAAEVAYMEVRPVWVVSIVAPATQTRPFIVGKIFDVVETMLAAGNPFDTFSDGVDTYMIIFSTQWTLALKVA